MLSEASIVIDPKQLDDMSSEELNAFVAKSKGNAPATSTAAPDDNFTSTMTMALKRYEEYLSKNPQVKNPVLQQQLMKYFIDQVDRERASKK